MKKILIIPVLIMLCASLAYGQTTLTYEQKADMVKKSFGLSLPPAVQQAAEQYATEHQYDYTLIQKNFIHLQVIFNPELDAPSRIAYCQYLIALWQYDNSSLPLPIINTQKDALTHLSPTLND